MGKKLFPFLCLILALTGCGQKPAPAQAQTAQVFAMDTVMDFTVYTAEDDLLEQAEQLVADLEHSLSTTDSGSEIYALNHHGSAALSRHPAALLEKALDFCRKTDGALDLSIYPVVRAWGFTTDHFQVPRPDTLEQLLAHVDYTQIRFDAAGKTVSVPEGMEIDLGSVAKGYTGDQILELFRENGVSSALLNLGGNVQALGKKPDGSLWKVGVRDPLGESYLGIVCVADRAVITSGGYERCFTGEDGTVYWHIIDPETGYPARNGMLSATAIGPEGVYCDALSTSLFIMGPEKAADFWREHGDFEMILVTDQRQVLITPGLADSFRLVDGAAYELQVIADA